MCQLPDESIVMRVVRRIAEHFPPGLSKPLPRAFALSTDDKKEALERSRPPLLSVYDRAKTTIEQAIALRRAPEEDLAVFPFASKTSSLSTSRRGIVCASSRIRCLQPQALAPKATQVSLGSSGRKDKPRST